MKSLLRRLSEGMMYYCWKQLHDDAITEALQG